MADPSTRVLLHGGHVLSTEHPTATAMAVEAGRIAWLGTEADASGWADGAHRVRHLDGRLVTPGFVDAHAHLAKTGMALSTLDLGAATSVTDALDRLAAHAAAGAAAGSGLLLAHGWDDSRWPERRPFTSAEVERATGDRAVYASRVDAHSAVVSGALAAHDLSITAAPGWRGQGLVERDAHHIARRIVDDLQTRDDRLRQLRLALQRCAEQGVTCAHDLNAPHLSPFDDRELLAEIGLAAPQPEVVSYWGALMGGEHADAEGLAGFAGDLCVDGSLGSRTAAITGGYADAAPHDDAPHDDAPSRAGHLYLDELAIRDHVVWCTERGTQAGFHVIGDRGLDTVESGLRLAAEKVGVEALARCRHRLEHVEMPSPSLIALMSRLGVVASVQPSFDAAWGHAGGMYAERVGAARAATMNPFATMVRAGVRLAFGSDSPVTPIDPWAGVRAAVRHHNADESLLVRTAFDAHTRGGHRARGDDASGVLATGAAATLAVWELPDGLSDRLSDEWSSDAWAVLDAVGDADESPWCALTVVDGRVVFDVEAVAPFASLGVTS